MIDRLGVSVVTKVNRWKSWCAKSWVLPFQKRSSWVVVTVSYRVVTTLTFIQAFLFLALLKGRCELLFEPKIFVRFVKSRRVASLKLWGLVFVRLIFLNFLSFIKIILVSQRCSKNRVCLRLVDIVFERHDFVFGNLTLIKLMSNELVLWPVDAYSV